MNQIFLTIDTLMYFLCILTIICKILENEIQRYSCIIADICVLVFLLFAALTFSESAFLLTWIIVQILQILLIYLSNSKTRLFSVITIYVLLYSITSILVVALNSVFALSMNSMAVVELFIILLVTACCVFGCFNRHIRYKLKQILYSIPRRIKTLTVFAFCICTWLIAVIIANPQMYVPSSWSVSVRIALIFFSLFICTTFPVLIITVLTNTYLKKQNESFERELEAQAEHYVALAESNKELRRFKHDFKNLRIGITKALTSGDCEIALEIIENGQNDFIQATDSIVKYNTGNGIVDAILSEKQKKATATNTIITFEGIIRKRGFRPPIYV